MPFEIVDPSENDTGDALVSEVLGIPLIIRGESSVRLLEDRRKFKPAWGGAPLSAVFRLPTLLGAQGGRAKLIDGTISARLGLPTLSKSQKGRASLFRGTISERLGIPTILKGR